MFRGYWLDDYTFICPAVDKDKNIQWIMITTAMPKNSEGTIQYDHITGKYFDMTIIDPNNFEWKGKRLKIEL